MSELYCAWPSCRCLGSSEDPCPQGRSVRPIHEESDSLAPHAFGCRCEECRRKYYQPDATEQDRAAVRAWLERRIARHQQAYDEALADPSTARYPKLRVYGGLLEALKSELEGLCAERDALR